VFGVVEQSRHLGKARAELIGDVAPGLSGGLAIGLDEDLPNCGDVPVDVANGRALLINDYAASPVQARPPSLVAGAERAA
jgi:hypothetical protein